MSNPLIYRGLRFSRTLDEAFKTPRYAAPIERPWPSLWLRARYVLRRWME